MMTNAEIIHAWKTQFHPMLVRLYEESLLEVPEVFNYKLEVERIVTALREQGFTAHFPIKGLAPVRRNVKEKF